MQGGDISNEVSPRLLIVWEGLLGLHQSKAAEQKFDWYMRWHRYKRAVNTFTLNELLAARIWDVTWRMKYSVDVISYLGIDFTAALTDRLDNEDLPIGHVESWVPEQLARRLAYMPHVAAIYDPNASHRFTYGSKSRIVSPVQTDLIGAF